jgi:hypothetical protein
VEVTNSGRPPVYVDAVSVRCGTYTGEVGGEPTDDIGPEVPRTLQAGQTQRWALPVSHFRLLWMRDEVPEDARVHAVVRLGTGQTFTTKESVRVDLLRELPPEPAEPVEP